MLRFMPACLYRAPACHPNARCRQSWSRHSSVPDTRLEPGDATTAARRPDAAVGGDAECVETGAAGEALPAHAAIGGDAAATFADGDGDAPAARQEADRRTVA